MAYYIIRNANTTCNVCCFDAVPQSFRMTSISRQDEPMEVNHGRTQGSEYGMSAHYKYNTLSKVPNGRSKNGPSADAMPMEIPDPGTSPGKNEQGRSAQPNI
eukprot:6175552-Pleurochrysis_carterae.AAC.1